MAFALRRVAVCLALCLSLFLSAADAFAAPKSVHVRGYTRKDGTYVSPHTRSAPGTSSYSTSTPRTRSSWTPPAAAPAPIGGKVYVHGYTRKDGVRVPPHTRNVPGAGNSRTVTTTRKTSSVVHLDTGTDLSRWAASHPVRRQTVRIPTFRYDASTSNRKAREYLERSAAARSRFLRQTGYPKGRPGYIVDHVVPLACGGPDDPSNMQWQTVEEAKAKDKIERRACS